MIAKQLIMYAVMWILKKIRGLFMKNLGKWFKDNAIRIAENQANKRINLYPAGKQADEKMDRSPLGEKSSDRMQRGLVTDSFLEFMGGLHDDNKEWWIDRLIQEAGAIKGGKYDGN